MKVSLQNLCPRCKGKGWYEVTKSGHHPYCDCGEVGGYLCPIPIQEQEQCAECDGTGLIRDVEESSHRNLKIKKQRDEI